MEAGKKRRTKKNESLRKSGRLSANKGIREAAIPDIHLKETTKGKKGARKKKRSPRQKRGLWREGFKLEARQGTMRDLDHLQDLGGERM